jgi:hypothetical protein
MRPTLIVLTLLFAAVVCAQTPNQTPLQPPNQTPIDPVAIKDPVYVCPMDPDVRSNNPGNCSRCGMKLVTGIPDPVEYHLDLTVTPRPPKVNGPSQLKFVVHDPYKDRPVKSFIPVHERLFHAFVVSKDLQFFIHDHPVLKDDAFYYDLKFPKAGEYRILGDFYPDGATPQLIAKTIFVPGTAPAPVKLARDYSKKVAENMQVELETIPPQPIAGQKTQLHFTITPGDGLEKYLAAWGHMLAASDDLIDMIHQHPFIADGGPHIQFTMVFPRARTFRVWVQFQRNGVVNTVHFDIPVKQLGL